jgi:hypothetical protein
VSTLLDTNICIAFLNGTDHGVRDRLLVSDRTEVVLATW